MKIMQKFFILICFLLFSVVSLNADNLCFAENNQLKVITNTAIIYKSLEYNDYLLFDTSDDESLLDESDENYNTVNNLLFEVSHGNILTFVDAKIEQTISINSSTQKFYFYKIDISKYDDRYNTQYSKNALGETINQFGYILESCTMPNDKSSLKLYLDTNTTIKSEKDAEIYEYDSLQNEYNLIGTLQKGHKIKLINGYDTSLEYTKIQYQDEELNIITCYIKTDMIVSSAISTATICAIILCISLVSIILIVLGVKKKKRIKMHN